MRRKNSNQKQFDKSVDVLRSLGIDVSSVENVEVDKTYRRHPAANSLDLIGCIVYLDTGGSNFSKQVCSNCGETYAVEYMYRTRGMMCSDECRAASLEKRGLYWDSRKPPQERWKKRIPLVVPPAALKVIEELYDEEATRPKQESGVSGLHSVLPLHSPGQYDSQGTIESLDLSEFGIE